MKQKPFTKSQLRQLLDNYETGGRTGTTPPPVVKFFCPWGAATWLICEAEECDGDYRLFGLCDLGHGTPEVGSVMLSDLQRIRGPLGLTIERDLYFTPDKDLSDYADEARALGYIAA